MDPEVAGWSKGWQEVWLSVVSFAQVAGGVGVVAAILFLVKPHVSRRWLPLRRFRPGQWTGAEVLLAFFFYMFAQTLVLGLLQEANFFRAIYGREPDVARVQIWIWPFALPLALALIFPMLYLVSRTFPSDLGLSLTRWPANVLLGFAGFAIVTLPLIMIVGLISLLEGSKNPHPLTKLATGTMMWWEWGLLLFAACAAAPLLEELLFRGILQGWLRRASLLGQMSFLTIAWFSSLNIAMYPNKEQEGVFANIRWPRVIFTVVLVAAYTGMLQYLKKKKLFQTEADFLPPASAEQAAHDGDQGEGEAQAEEIILTPGQQEARARWLDHDKNQQRQKAGLAIFGSALAFALGHPSWPDPIPLLALGLILGWLAQRTHNLVPCIVLHSLFNLVAFLVLFQTPATNGNDATSALRPSAAGSTTNSAPASWLPRFR